MKLVERTLSPARRILFTCGWARADVEVPPGSTTVEIAHAGGRDN